MYRVVFFDEAVWDDEVVFSGSIAECREYIRAEYAHLGMDDDDDMLFIVDEDYNEVL